MSASNSSATVLVAGATGYVGRYLSARLHEQGYRVRALVRSRERAERPGASGAPSLAGIVDEWVVAPSPQDAAERTNLLEGVEHVVSALGVTTQRADPWTIDFLGNLRLLERAEAAGARSFLYIGVMNAALGTSGLSHAKAAFIEVLRRSSVTPLIINPSGYFSDMTEFLDLAERGIAVRLGPGLARLAPIHGADLAAFSVSKLDAGRGEWDVGGPEHLAYRDIVERAFAALGKRPRWTVIPEGATRPAVWLADRISPRAGSLTRFFLDGIQQDSVGEVTGTHHLADYYREVVEARRR